MTKMRIWLKKPGASRATKKFVLLGEPFPRVRDVVTIKGEDFIVTKTEDASDAIEIKFPAKARQVFP